MTTNTETKDQIDTLAQEREDRKIQVAEIMAKLAKQHPEENIASKGEWWVPSIDFNFDIKGRLPAETQEKLNACLQRIIDQKYAPEAVDPALDEAKGYLAGHEDLLAQFNKMFGNRGFWDTMHKHELEKEKKSADGGDTE